MILKSALGLDHQGSEKIDGGRELVGEINEAGGSSHPALNPIPELGGADSDQGQRSRVSLQEVKQVKRGLRRLLGSQ